MEGVFHFGADSEKYLRDFESKRADYEIQEISGWTPKDLKDLVCILQADNRTFAAAEGATV